MTLVHSWLSSIALQVGDCAMEGLACTCMDNNMASLMGSEMAIPYQGISPYVVRPEDFFDCPLVQLLQGVAHFCQVLGHALVFGFVFLPYMSHDELRIIVDSELRDG